MLPYDFRSVHPPGPRGMLGHAPSTVAAATTAGTPDSPCASAHWED